MPPKKEKGKGKKEKKTVAAPEYVPDKKLSENDKKFYTMQIELLEKQYEKYTDIFHMCIYIFLNLDIKNDAKS